MDEGGDFKPSFKPAFEPEVRDNVGEVRYTCPKCKDTGIVKEADGIPMLIDLGIARLANDPLYYGNEIAGTPAYIPIEVLKGGKADKRSDIYSLATVLYSLVEDNHISTAIQNQGSFHAIQQAIELQEN